MKVDFWILFFVATIVQGVFLSLTLFLRPGNINKVLAGFVLSFSLCLVSYVAYWSDTVSEIGPWIMVLVGLPLTFGPLLYSYIRSGSNAIRFLPAEYFPYLIYIVLFVFRESLTAGMVFLVQLLMCLHLSLYMVLIAKFVHANKGYKNGKLKIFSWRKFIALFFVGYVISYWVYSILNWMGILQVEQDYMVSVAGACMIYGIGYLGINFPEYLKYYESATNTSDGGVEQFNIAIYKKIKQVMEESSMYLDAGLSLNNLAEKSGVNQHIVSQVINSHLGMNINDFINEYRIEEAKKQLMSEDKKVIAIAYDSGFSNKVTFYKAFKKFTGLSPTEYKDKFSSSSC